MLSGNHGRESAIHQVLAQPRQVQHIPHVGCWQAWAGWGLRYLNGNQH